MLQHLLISTVSLFVMIAGWYSLQQLMQQGRATRGIDFLKGRWGCGDCSCLDTCDPEEKTGQALKT